ncbi:alpha-1,2-mannosidase [Cordyceps javanica]|uniref:Alpha-1,2-mannosidase n=1 Tax=Cordyceps javanica TaxID=43265 RepID=A0A545VDR2_9HYPO|nr:alpha-1,2-mannosidase [Cordyceps javanica]TQW10467.1 glycosyl hydrolase family 92 [Cordyceps javanica]
MKSPATMLLRVLALGQLLHVVAAAAQDSNSTQDSAKFDVLDYVDPLIGTVNGGHVFPGASLPYSMAKAVADVNKESQGGFASNDADVTGFSHMHDSGTGGGASLGNFPLFAQTGCPGNELNRCYFNKISRASQRKNGTVVARPGYFAISLNTSVTAEMTVSNHTALYRFTFPTDGTPTKVTDPHVPYVPLIIADLSDLSESRRKATVLVDGTTGRITGNGTFSPSFGVGTYDSHFCVDFHGAQMRDNGVWINNRAGKEPKSLNVTNQVPAGAWVQFGPPQNNQILARVGLSFISTEQACKNAEKEIPDYGFESIRNQAEDAWRAKLNVIKVDNTGENPLWKSDEPYFDSYYCIWDSFRSTHPFLTLVDPHAQALMIRSLIDIYRHEGKMPDCRMSLCKGFTQGGSNADNLLADSYLKGLTDGIDWETGYEAVISDAEDEPPLWTVEGRGGLHSWKTLGYIPTDDFDPYGVGIYTRSISRTIEYSYNDFCIAEMARGMGKVHDAGKYLNRSGNWLNMFDPTSRSRLNLTGSRDPADLVDSGFQGFLQPRYLNGTFGYQDPAICTDLYNFTSCYLNDDGHETYEGGAWLYTFYVPHDVATLVPALGGADEFLRRLRYLHETPGLFYIGDEQSYIMLFLFHYVGRPGLSSAYAHRYIPSAFNDTLVGIPGNDDSGSMASFTALAMMGLFPMSGQDVYLITAPFFRELSVRNSVTGKTATVRTLNFDAAYGNIYIQNATLDGRPHMKSWLTHDFFRNGGVLELHLGPRESGWGSGADHIPPSASTHFWK